MFAKQLAALLLVAVAFAGCEDGVNLDLLKDELSNQTYYDAVIDPKKLCSDVKVAKSNGGILRGTRDCSVPTAKLCETPGDTSCYLTDASLYGLDPKHHVPESFRKGVAIGEITGELIANDKYCAKDGEDDCVATDERKSVTKAGAAAKVAIGEQLLGVAGTFAPDFPEAAHVLSSAATGGVQGALPLCQNSVTTNCVLTTAYRAVLPSALIAGDIKSGEVIGAVTGSYVTSRPDCSASGEQGCVATSRYAAVQRSRVTASNLETGYTILGVSGSVQPKPNQCAADNEVGCVAKAPMRAIDKSAVNAGIVRKGITIAGIAGDFPSLSHPLQGADNAIADLNSASFAGQIVSSASFELWDSAGRRHVLQGSANLVPAKVVTGTTIFGVAGSATVRPNDCSSDGEQACVAQGGFPAITKALVTPGILRHGVSLAGVTGDYPSATHRLAADTARADLSFPSDLSSADAVEFFDATGARHTVNGSADLTASNILSGVTLFGVNGAAIATPPTCSAHDQPSCVADAAHPAYKKADLTAEVLKKGTTLSGVAGNFPSPASRLIGASGTSDLTAGSFATTIATNASFEFWDATGLRHTVSGDERLQPANILAGVTVFGKDGALAHQPLPCSLTSRNCLTTVTHPSYDPAVVTEAVVKNGIDLGEVTGKYPSAGYPLQGATAMADLTSTSFNSRVGSAGSFEYFDSAGQRFSAVGDSDLVAANIRQGQTLFGVTGAAIASPANCAAENAASCVTTSSYPAFDKAKLSAEDIKAGTTVLGVTGTYPSAANPLAAATATVDLTASGFDAAMASAASFEFFDSAGQRQTATGSSQLIPAHISQGTTIFSVAGTILPTPSSCSAVNQTGCMATATFPAFAKSALTPGVLKNGVSLYGVTGQYPSASFPLNGATATVDLTAANFTSLHQSPTPFEFFDSAGSVQQGQGDADLQPANINQGVTILGVAGTLVGMAPERVWDYVHGTFVSGVQGKVKPNCRNTADFSFQTGSGSYNSLDDQNMTNQGVFPSDNPWGSSDHVCGAEVFTDVSYNTALSQPTSCVAGSTEVVCMHKDRISGLTWREAPAGSTGLTWHEANTFCNNLVQAGHSDWRLPTLKESFAAYSNGIHRLKVSYNEPGEMNETYRTNYEVWTSTADKVDNSIKILVRMSQGIVTKKMAASINKAHSHCVRD